jgi:hypothetical protein
VEAAARRIIIIFGCNRSSRKHLAFLCVVFGLWFGSFEFKFRFYELLYALDAELQIRKTQDQIVLKMYKNGSGDLIIIK